NFSQQHARILLFAKDSPDRRGDLTWCQNGGRYLIEQRLKEMMICTIEKNDARRRALERLCCSQAAKATTDDHDDRHFTAHTNRETSRQHFCLLAQLVGTTGKVRRNQTNLL